MSSVNEQASKKGIDVVIACTLEITAREAALTLHRNRSGLWPRDYIVGFSVAFALFAFTTASWGQVTSSAGPSSSAQTAAHPGVATLLRFEPTGLSLLKPYARGRIPVVLIHGLWSSPWSWARMVEILESDVALRDRYQFWTFGYSTGDPLPYSAVLLRHGLDEVRRKFDPDHTDPAFDRMVIVGHSMGGLLTKMMVQDSGTRLWRLLSDRPARAARGRTGRLRPVSPSSDLQAAS